MKWYLIIGSAIVVIGGVLALLFSGSPKEDTATIPAPGLPMASSTTSTGGVSGLSMEPTVSFATPGGAVATVKNFIRNGETVPDVQNPGSYVLAGSVGYCLADGTCPSGASTTDFNISYNEQTHFFNIVLLKEPLGTVRLAAEQFLTDRLGLTGQEACNLNYFVGTPYWVNEAYDDKNLGFSFCPGATTLPK